MYLLENPVLQRELLVNLRMMRGFALLAAYVAALGAVVYVAWPTTQRLDLTTSPAEARQLVNGWFDERETVYMEEVLKSDIGDHQFLNSAHISSVFHRL